MKRLICALLPALALLATPARAANCEDSPLNGSLEQLMGDEVSLCRHFGEVVLVVNTASQCGFTSQYEGLEALHRQYRDQGFTVIGVPSDQFGGQEFADDAKIANFCRVNFGVSFPMYTRSAVKGAEAIPLFKALTAATGQAPQWNFHKYLIDRDGAVLGQWPSGVKPQDAQLTEAIEKALLSQD